MMRTEALSPDKTAESSSKRLDPDPDLWLQSTCHVLSSLGIQTLRDLRRGDINSSLYLLIRHISLSLFQSLSTWFPSGNTIRKHRKAISPNASLFPRDQVRSQVNPVFYYTCPQSFLIFGDLTSIMLSQPWINIFSKVWHLGTCQG